MCLWWVWFLGWVCRGIGKGKWGDGGMGFIAEGFLWCGIFGGVGRVRWVGVGEDGMFCVGWTEARWG